MKSPGYITIPELAKYLGISRIAVYKRIKLQKIGAEKIGNIYVIPASHVEFLLGHKLSPARKKMIDKIMTRIFDEYGEVLHALANE